MAESNEINQEESLKLENQLCFPLYAAARKVTNLYTPFFSSLGLTYTQYIVFLVLWEKDNETVGDLCKKLFLDHGTLTPLLKKMETLGYISRKRSKQDERIVTVSLTQKGKDLKEKAKEIPGQVGSCLRLSSEKCAQLYRLLYELLNVLDPEDQ